jgi:predicted GTPase
MPYGDLARQAAQRFATREDLAREGCTIEEREEYEPHLAAGNTVHAGVDTARVLARASEGADLILWDGGNNDFPFVRPDLHLVLADALRPGQEIAFHPGETCLRMADAVVVTKCDAARPEDVAQVCENARRANPRARLVRSRMPVRLDAPEAVRGRRVLVVEDGPTITHGGMAHGAGLLAARAAGAAAIVDPRTAADSLIAAVYAAHPHIGQVLPATGYSPEQLDALRRTINRAAADVVVSATPIDLGALLALDKPVVRARYEFEDGEAPGVADIVDRFLAGAFA